VQYAGGGLRPYPGMMTAEVHDYYDTGTDVLASSLAKTCPRLCQPWLSRPRG
jgi:hypothetical protein